MEHFTINGRLFLAFANHRGDIKNYKTASMICKMNESNGRLSLYQTMQTRGALDLEYFSIANKHFLAVANHFDETHRLDSIVYQWNGKLFAHFQKLSTNGAGQFTYFKVHGEHYLALANHYNESIYKWSSGKFNRFQDIPTEGAVGCTVFVINGDTFIAFANYYNSQHKYSVQSTVFKWSGGRFVKLQSLQTYGAFDVKCFNINTHTFLVFANRYSGSKRNIDSFIYKWNGNKFVLFQSLPTHGAVAWHQFVINGQTYLGVSNHYDDSKKYNTQSVVYQASGVRFIKYQEIPTDSGHGMTSFKYKGQTYLAVANNYNGRRFNINSALYKWV